MLNQIINLPLFWIFITLLFYKFAGYLMKKWSNPLFTPLLFSIILIILILLFFDIDLEVYNRGGQYFSFWITPATVALAIKLEKNFIYLKKYYKEVLTGILMGLLFHTSMVYFMAYFFKFDYQIVASIIPKSITTAIAVGVSESLGGIVSLTVAMVVFTGIFGTLIAQPLFKILKITNPVAQGVALGSSSHAMGTTKAIELGEVQAAMSSLSLVVTGIVVVILAPFTLPITNLFFQ